MNTYALEVSIGLSARTGLTVQEAKNIVGDTKEYEDEGLTVKEAIEATIDAMHASS